VSKAAFSKLERVAFLILSSVFSLGIGDLMLHPACYTIVTRLREAHLRNLETERKDD
jgi:hypothetical protein